MAANRTRFRGRRERDPAPAGNAKRPGDIGTCLGSVGAAVYKQIINITFRRVVGGVAQTISSMALYHGRYPHAVHDTVRHRHDAQRRFTPHVTYTRTQLYVSEPPLRVVWLLALATALMA
jgi:hypothetical protein